MIFIDCSLCHFEFSILDFVVSLSQTMLDRENSCLAMGLQEVMQAQDLRLLARNGDVLDR